MSLSLTEMNNEIFSDHTGEEWVERELLKLETEIWELTRVVQNISAFHCLTSLITLKFCSLHYVEVVLKKFMT